MLCVTYIFMFYLLVTFILIMAWNGNQIFASLRCYAKWCFSLVIISYADLKWVMYDKLYIQFLKSKV